MATFNVETLQDMFLRVEKKELTKQAAAGYFNTSVGCINNYFCAKKAYDQGRKVYAQNVSVKVFTPWAVKYGGNGEPIYKADPNPNRKHVKKEPEQQKMVLPDPKTGDHKEHLSPMDYFLYEIKTKFDLSTQDGRLEYARYAADILRVLFRHGDSIYQYVPLVSLITGFHQEIVWEQIMKGEHTNV